jgi:hypothetical protein
VQKPTRERERGQNFCLFGGKGKERREEINREGKGVRIYGGGARVKARARAATDGRRQGIETGRESYVTRTRTCTRACRQAGTC